MKQLNHQETQSAKQFRDIRIVCDGIVLPVNIGSTFRLADAFAAEEVIFGGPVDLKSRKIKQVSRSTHSWVKHRVSTNLKFEILKFKEAGFQIVAIEITDESEELYHQQFHGDKLVLIIGSEIHGVSQELLNHVDHCYHIPLFGKNSSINAGQALAIALYEFSGHSPHCNNQK